MVRGRGPAGFETSESGREARVKFLRLCLQSATQTATVNAAASSSLGEPDRIPCMLLARPA